MTKMFYFTVNDVDVDNHCDRDNNQDHTIIIDDRFDTTIIDNKFYTTCTTMFDTVIESHTIEEEEVRTIIDDEFTTSTTTVIKSHTTMCATIYDTTITTCITTIVVDDTTRTTNQSTMENDTVPFTVQYTNQISLNKESSTVQYSNQHNILYIIQDTIQISSNGEPCTVQYSKSCNGVHVLQVFTHTAWPKILRLGQKYVLSTQQRSWKRVLYYYVSLTVCSTSKE